jgi:hypothetical protein
VLSLLGAAVPDILSARPLPTAGTGQTTWFAPSNFELSQDSVRSVNGRSSVYRYVNIYPEYIVKMQCNPTFTYSNHICL